MALQCYKYINSEEFQDFIKIKVEKRNREIAKSQNLRINASPEFIEIFKKSQAISTTKGKSHLLARNPSLTNDQHKIITLEEEKKELNNKTAFLETELDDLRTKIRDLQKDNEACEGNSDKLSKLFDLGIIDENGELIQNDMNIS